MKGGLLVATAAFFQLVYANPVEKRAADYISSCGPDWMALENVKSNHGQIDRRGYNSAVDFFCDKAGGQTVGGQLYLSMATRAYLTYGGNPTNTGLNGYVYFEIHNKRNNEHKVDAGKCKEYLKKLSDPSSKCYGKTNKDTKGGTWQVGNDDVSYHALGEKAPPTFSSLDKTVILTTAIAPLPSNGKGPTLDPFPTYTFDDIVPVNCHSHNDYERDFALYSALSAGCTGVEADIWPHGDRLTVGHTNPGANGPTLQNLYLAPLKKLIDERKAVFPARPQQGIDLLIDFKGGADQTWDLLVAALKPLREAGYLSRVEGGKFVKGLVTVVVSGNGIRNEGGSVPEPLARALDEQTNPGRSVFTDARVNKDMSRFDATNAYYASANFKSAVQGGGGELSGGNLQTLRDQVRAAHAKGFVVRYWDIPNTNQWQQLVDEGVDRLNVDNLQDVSALNWHL